MRHIYLSIVVVMVEMLFRLCCALFKFSISGFLYKESGILDGYSNISLVLAFPFGKSHSIFWQFSIMLRFSCGYFCHKGFGVIYPSEKALSGQDIQFDFYHVQLVSIFGSIVDFKALHNPTCLRLQKRFIKRGWLNQSTASSTAYPIT